MPRRLLLLPLALAIAILPYLPTAPLSRAQTAPDPTATATMTTSTTSASTSTSSMVMNPYADPPDCGLSQPAFCDSFTTPSPGGTAGDLNDANWSFARMNQMSNEGAGVLNVQYPAQAMFCQTPISGVLPPADSFFCDGTNGVTTQDQGTEPMHWMTALNDGDQYALVAARIRQPFDFAGRTGTISFGVDAVTRGSHSWWPQVVIADQPANGPDGQHPATDPAPKDGVLVQFNAGCPLPGDGTVDSPTTQAAVTVFHNYAETDLGIDPSGQCVSTARDDANRFRLQLSQDELQIFGTDAGSDQFKLLGTYTGLGLGFTRGYVSFEQVQYAAEKFNGEGNHTYHWHAIGFDGPVLPTPRAYEAQDPLLPSPVGGGAENDAWETTAQGLRLFDAGAWQAVPAITIPGVDPSGASQAVLEFDTNDVTASNPITFAVNGGPAQTVQEPPTQMGNGWTAFAVAVPLAQLAAGANAVTFRSPQAAEVANVSLELETGGTVLDTLMSSTTAGDPTTATPTATPTPTAAPSSTATASPTAAPTATPAPTATATTAPSSSPTPTSSSDTPTPMPAQTVGMIDGLHYACTSHDSGATYQCVRP